jgi:integrase
MARRIGILSALAVKAAAARGLHSDGGGLCLQVARGGSRSWILRFRHAGRRRHLGLGGFPVVTLAEARERAAAARAMLQAGKDPVEERHGRRIATVLAGAKAMTFGQAADAYVEAHSGAWKPRNTKQWTTSLDTYALPLLGKLPVQAIDTGLVMQVIEPIWATKNETADRVRGRIEAILNWAAARGHREGGANPARWKGHLANLLPPPAKITEIQHHEAMPYAALPTFMARLRARNDVAARALEFAILTAARTGEVLNADWSEIDLQAGVWTVPGARMKGGRTHRVPLVSAALSLLETLPGARAGLVFPGFRDGKPLAKMALANVLKRAGGDGATVHGMRSAFRDWSGDRTAFARDVIEAALAHRVGDTTEAAYRRGDAIDKRRVLMQAWAGYLAGEAAEVIELRRA